MNFLCDIKSTLFFFGFQECKKKNNVSFLKLASQDYLVMRVFEKYETADLVLAKCESDHNPCDSEPYWEEPIKLSFNPHFDNYIIRDFIKQFKNE